MPVRIDRVYTKTGDKGKTALIGGSRVLKSHPRIEAYGTVDELNAAVGVLRAHLSEGSSQEMQELKKELDPFFQDVQQDLFNLGADLATPISDEKKTDKLKPKLSEDRVNFFEKAMDTWQQSLAPLTSFVLPGGSHVPAQLHLCRTICRRAERLTVNLSQSEAILGPAVIYLNRLSDTLFVLSRYAAKRLGEPEFLWKY